MNRYFDTCNTLEDAKKLYKALAIQNHPDHGGDLRTMQEINAQYAEFIATFANREARQRQEEAHKANRKSAADFHNIDEVTEILRQKIEAALNLDGVNVEVCGLWVWLIGETYQHRAALGKNGLGFKYANKKDNPSAWFFAGVPSFNREKRTLEEIRNIHGSTSYYKAEREELNALPA